MIDFSRIPRILPPSEAQGGAYRTGRLQERKNARSGLSKARPVVGIVHHFQDRQGNSPVNPLAIATARRDHQIGYRAGTHLRSNLFPTGEPMLARTLTVLLLGLAFASPVLAQPQPRPDPRPGPTPPRAANADTDRLIALLDELISLQRQSKPVAPQPAPTPLPQVRIYAFRAADSIEVAKTLTELFQGDAGRKFRLAVHQSTNSLLILGTPEDIELIEGIITRLDTLSAERKKAQGQ
jgi:hypothetical protein